MTPSEISQRIVLVEDDLDIRSILDQLLSDAGYSVTALHEGREILELHFPAPSLFILDINLPNIDGIAICKFLKLQAHLKSVPVLVLSANRSLKSKALIAGAQTFIEKPFKIERLLCEVSYCLAGQTLISR